MEQCYFLIIGTNVFVAVDDGTTIVVDVVVGHWSKIDVGSCNIRTRPSKTDCDFGFLCGQPDPPGI
jgi:hypothetical protein